MRSICKAISWVFHPILLNFLLVLIAFGMDRYAYYIAEAHNIQVFLFMSFFVLVLFPVVGTAVFRGIGTIPSWEMPDKKDRIVVLIMTLVFYIWFFLNVKNNASIPDSLVFIALGSTIALGLAFFINNFSKISLHTVGAGAFLMGLILLVFHTQNSYFKVDLPFSSSFYLSSIFVVLVATMIAGLIGTVRLILKHHTLEDIIGGYTVGIIAQLAAYNVIT